MRNDPLLCSVLCCPACQNELRLYNSGELSSDGHIMTGELQCIGCNVTYPILNGVPRFVASALKDNVSQTIEGFGYQWKQSNLVLQNTRFTGAETFLDFIEPVQPEYFKRKVVLDAGCGAARFTCWTQQFGATAVVGVDLSNSVDVAFENTRSFPNVLIIQADLLSLPLRQSFDYVFSVGVLHHTSAPRLAFERLVSLIKPGGGISAWVYGRENNEWIIYLLNPIRHHLTSRLPRNVPLTLAYLIALPMFLALKGIYKPVGKFQQLAPLRKYLFYFDYLYFLSNFGFHEQAYIVFDHLVPAIAEYIPREEFAQWFEGNHLQNVVITSRAENSWRGFGIRSSIASLNQL
jgi:SAM-dependent methyltransferase